MNCWPLRGVLNSSSKRRQSRFIISVFQFTEAFKVKKVHHIDELYKLSTRRGFLNLRCTTFCCLIIFLVYNLDIKYMSDYQMPGGRLFWMIYFRVYHLGEFGLKTGIGWRLLENPLTFTSVSALVMKEKCLLDLTRFLVSASHGTFCILKWLLYICLFGLKTNSEDSTASVSP